MSATHMTDSTTMSRAGALPRTGAELDHLEADLHRRGRAEAQASLHPGTRLRRPDLRDPGRSAPVRPARGSAGHLLLRGRPRWLLAPSLPRAPPRREPRGKSGGGNPVSGEIRGGNPAGGNPVSVHHSGGNPVSVHGGNPVSGNPVSVHHSCPGEIRCRGKSGVRGEIRCQEIRAG